MDASYQYGLVALAGGGQTGGTLISRTFSRFTTVASAADSALLPSAASGLTFTIKNGAANSMNLFPGVGDQINAAGANTAFAIAAGKMAQVSCIAPGIWEVLLSA
jgi:hypothetical protein